MARGNSSGWFRRKKGALIYTWGHMSGRERAKVVGTEHNVGSEDGLAWGNWA